MNCESRIALFPGSFDPFTRGHQAIVERALPMFDKLVIAIGINRAKKGWMPVEERLERLERLYAEEPRGSYLRNTYYGFGGSVRC